MRFKWPQMDNVRYLFVIARGSLLRSPADMLVFLPNLGSRRLPSPAPNSQDRLTNSIPMKTSNLLIRNFACLLVCRGVSPAGPRPFWAWPRGRFCGTALLGVWRAVKHEPRG